MSSSTSFGDRYLVTVHGPLNPAVDPAAAMVEVDTVLARLASGSQADKGFELSMPCSPH